MALVPSGRAALNRLKRSRWWFGFDDRELENLLFVGPVERSTDGTCSYDNKCDWIRALM